jgi:hypothetical protein
LVRFIGVWLTTGVCDLVSAIWRRSFSVVHLASLRSATAPA